MIAKEPIGEQWQDSILNSSLWIRLKTMSPESIFFKAVILKRPMKCFSPSEVQDKLVV